MKKRRIVAALLLVLILLTISHAYLWGMGYEYGTGLPMAHFLMPESKDIYLPEDVTVKTTEEAKKVVEEAIKDKNYEVGYHCLDYAWDSMRALNWDGQPAAIAKVTYEDGTAHALVLTATEDRTWMFLDPKTGLEVTPVPGGYWGDKRIVSVTIMTVQWVDFEEFVKNPKIEVNE